MEFSLKSFFMNVFGSLSMPCVGMGETLVFTALSSRAMCCVPWSVWSGSGGCNNSVLILDNTKKSSISNIFQG